MDKKIFEIYRLKQQKAAKFYRMECEQEAKLRALLQSISARKHPSSSQSVSAMQLTGYEDRWHVWSDNRRIILNQKLALCLARKDEKRQRLASRQAEMIAQDNVLKSSELKRQRSRSLLHRADLQDLMLLEALAD